MEQSLDNNHELLAPAGDFESLKYAVAGGCNAVYLGLTDFNARSKAKNFTMEELRLAVSYCHERGVRVYLTMNTLFKDKELMPALKLAKEAKDAGIDAVLVQDLAFLQLLKKELPELSIHASTQMGVHNKEGSAFAAKLGVDRIVLSRETLPEDISKISDSGIETEFFVHGAMCVSFSGNCYLSSIVSGYSGNRGKCLQLCRKKYTLTCDKDKKTGYMLSPKDICMLPALDKLKKLGVKSYKIEGRLRSKEYAYTTSEAYSRAIAGKSRPGDIDKLKTVFNRGDYSTLYVNNDREDIIYDKQQNNIGLQIGKVMSVNPLRISGNYKLRDGDGLKFLRNGRESGSGSVARGKTLISGKVIAGDTAHITKSGISVAPQDAGEKSPILQYISQKHDSIASDIIPDKFIFSDNCVILKADEHTPAKLLDKCDYIIYSPEVYDTSILDFKKKVTVPVLLDMPIIARGKDMGILKSIVGANLFDGYVANNIYALELCKGRLIAGSSLNILSESVTPKISSIESAVIGDKDVLYAFGRYALMNFSHCPYRQLGQKCGQCGGALSLRDESGNAFTLRRKKMHYCYFELLNGKITNILGNAEKCGRLLIDATGINEAEAYAALTKLRNTEFDRLKHTVGRFGKGVK